MYEVINRFEKNNDDITHYQPSAEVEEYLTNTFTNKFTTSQIVNGNVLTITTVWASRDDFLKYSQDPIIRSMITDRKTYNSKNQISSSTTFKEI